MEAELGKEALVEDELGGGYVRPMGGCGDLWNRRAFRADGVAKGWRGGSGEIERAR